MLCIRSVDMKKLSVPPSARPKVSHCTFTNVSDEDPEDGDHITVRSDEEMQDMFAAVSQNCEGLFALTVHLPRVSGQLI